MGIEILGKSHNKHHLLQRLTRPTGLVGLTQSTAISVTGISDTQIPFLSQSPYSPEEATTTMINARRTARKPTDAEQRDLDIHEHEEDVYYSPKYTDDLYEYRHVTVPKPIAKWMPQGRLLAEYEWRGFGIKQSPGWVHFMIHNPEPHILLFRREKDFQLKYPNATINTKVGGLVG
ncbi:hypothetical protein BASA61_002207 [Batrachochytrium salamandrivorans]|nr:hypothetical protein BASA61_002207 [Batrachochytrium salamandrivorans]